MDVNPELQQISIHEGREIIGSSQDDEISGGYQGLNKFVRLITKFQGEDFDILTGVSSFKGFGKSTFSIQSSKRHVVNNLKRPWDLPKYTAWDNEDVKLKAKLLEDRSPMNCDEAVRFAMAEDWMYWDSRQLKKLFTQFRTKHLSVFFNIPDLWWIDRKYREGMMTIWVHIIAKGYAIMFLPDLRPGLDDRWHRKELLEIVKPYNFFTPLDRVVESFRRHPCYFDEFRFPKLPADEYKRYLKLREEKVFQGEGSQDVANMGAIAAYNLYSKPEMLRDLIKGEGEIKSPTYEWIAGKLFDHPFERGRPLTTKDTIRMWIRKVALGQYITKSSKLSIEIPHEQEKSEK